MWWVKKMKNKTKTFSILILSLEEKIVQLKEL